MVLPQLLVLCGAVASGTRSGYRVTQAHTLVNATMVHVWAPETETSVPVFFFMGGFAGDAPVTMYGQVLSSIASSGVYVVGLSRLQVPNYPKEAQALSALIEWAAAGGLREALPSLSARPDVLNRTLVGGQSAGCHVVGQMLADGCSFAKGLVLMDPVDGYDPFGIVTSENLIVPGVKLNFTTPTLLTRAGLDPKRANPLYPPCAPDKLSNDRFFRAMRGPTWLLNATAFGHVDCLDPGASAGGGIVCASAGVFANKTAYRTFLTDTIVSFFEMLLSGDAAQLPSLEDAQLVSSRFGIDVITAHDYEGFDPKQVVPGCSHI